MLFTLDPHSAVPIFRQLMDQVRLHVASGRLRPGDELPSIRNLAVPLGVNPMTISKAYNLLEREGVLERRPGRPLVVSDHEPARLRAERLASLRRALRPAVAVARELGLSGDEAAALLRQMLADRADRDAGPGAAGDRGDDAAGGADERKDP